MTKYKRFHVVITDDDLSGVLEGIEQLEMIRSGVDDEIDQKEADDCGNVPGKQMNEMKRGEGQCVKSCFGENVMISGILVICSMLFMIMSLLLKNVIFVDVS